jgi:hypothetical protein
MSANPPTVSFKSLPSALAEIDRLRRLLELAEDVINGLRTGAVESSERVDGLWVKQFDRAGLREAG